LVGSGKWPGNLYEACYPVLVAYKVFHFFIRCKHHATGIMMNGGGRLGTCALIYRHLSSLHRHFDAFGIRGGLNGEACAEHPRDYPTAIHEEGFLTILLNIKEGFTGEVNFSLLAFPGFRI